MLEKVTDRGGLLFYQWLLRRVYADMPLPGDAELKELRKAFVRVFDAFKARTRPLAEDMDLVAKWTDDDDAAMSWGVLSVGLSDFTGRRRGSPGSSLPKKLACRCGS